MLLLMGRQVILPKQPLPESRVLLHSFLNFNEGGGGIGPASRIPQPDQLDHDAAHDAIATSSA
jgi:hypothetical protein